MTPCSFLTVGQTRCTVPFRIHRHRRAIVRTTLNRPAVLVDACQRRERLAAVARHGEAHVAHVAGKHMTPCRVDLALRSGGHRGLAAVAHALEELAFRHSVERRNRAPTSAPSPRRRVRLCARNDRRRSWQQPSRDDRARSYGASRADRAPRPAIRDRRSRPWSEGSFRRRRCVHRRVSAPFGSAWCRLSRSTSP